ncbi:hypothetical protein ACFX16_018743 [Malus domestica]
MKFSMLIVLCLLALPFQHSHSTTILVDEVSRWKNPTVQNQRAFDLCNFTQATLLSKPDSTSFTWHPSRIGFFYFAFNNGSLLIRFFNLCQKGTMGEDEKVKSEALQIIERH